MSLTPQYAIIVAVAALIVAVIVAVTVLISRVERRHVAARALGSRIPRRVKVRPNRTGRDDAAFTLRFPYWRSATRGGERDRARHDHKLMRLDSQLRYGDYVYSSRDPFTMYDFVRALRERGHLVPLCGAELEKRRRLSDEATAAHADSAAREEEAAERFAQREGIVFMGQEAMAAMVERVAPAPQAYAPMDCTLTREDLLAYLPSDLRRRYR
ncbi:MAG: hypothetical protein UHD09_01775 [Bifidobacterium sp.]|nr:hypothetical protein [Bifidobacterium sp.]